MWDWVAELRVGDTTYEHNQRMPMHLTLDIERHATLLRAGIFSSGVRKARASIIGATRTPITCKDNS